MITYVKKLHYCIIYNITITKYYNIIGSLLFFTFTFTHTYKYAYGYMYSNYRRVSLTLKINNIENVNNDNNININLVGIKKRHIIANWKSYLDYDNFIILSRQLKSKYNTKSDLFDSNNVIILPPVFCINEIKDILVHTSINVGAQCVSPYLNGPFTGEISAPSLKQLGCKYSLVGHFERKLYFRETDKNICKSTYNSLVNGITPIFCFGDTKIEFQDGDSFERCIYQINNLLYYLKNNNIEHEMYKKIIFAYEPIWAIGTGLVPDEKFLDKIYYNLHCYISRRYGFNPCILYGFSVSENNVKLFSRFDGILVGYQSINQTHFVNIIKNTMN